MQLLAVACLSLASKIEETKVPQIVDLQVMELLVIDLYLCGFSLNVCFVESDCVGDVNRLELLSLFLRLKLSKEWSF